MPRSVLVNHFADPALSSRATLHTLPVNDGERCRWPPAVREGGLPVLSAAGFNRRTRGAATERVASFR